MPPLVWWVTFLQGDRCARHFAQSARSYALTFHWWSNQPGATDKLSSKYWSHLASNASSHRFRYFQYTHIALPIPLLPKFLRSLSSYALWLSYSFTTAPYPNNICWLGHKIYSFFSAIRLSQFSSSRKYLVFVGSNRLRCTLRCKL